MFRRKAIVLCIAVVQMLSCREPYDPSLEQRIVSYLVVEGFINTSGVTTIQLSRTQKLAEKGVIKYELYAAVQIEGEDGTVRTLTGTGNGIYTSASNNLPSDRKYRLKIKTSAGKEYLSDYVSVKITPQFKLGWEKDDKGVNMTVSTSDPAKKTLYYKWMYEETWEINSVALSEFTIVRRAPVVISKRPDAEQILIFRCWADSRSTSILTTATTAFSDDIVDRFPLAFIPNGSDKLAVRYSLLVKQYALTREAYEFFELMKKNSQQLGSLFDPQPTTITGNIKSVTKPAEIVIGYIVASSAVEQRIFVTGAEAGDWKSSLFCPSFSVKANSEDLYTHFATPDLLIQNGVYENPNNSEMLTGYNARPAACLDCRLRGSTIKPGFW